VRAVDRLLRAVDRLRRAVDGDGRNIDRLGQTSGGTEIFPWLPFLAFFTGRRAMARVGSLLERPPTLPYARHRESTGRDKELSVRKDLSMKLTAWFVILCAAVPLPGRAQEVRSPSILESRVERHEGPPLWISAEAVADREKIIDLDLIDSLSLRMNVEKQRRELGDRLAAERKAGEKPTVTTIPQSECKRMQFVEDDRGGGGPSTTLSDLSTRSQSIVRGTVRTIELGFDGGVPASLLGVELSEVIKGPKPQSPFYVLYPVARFRIGPYHFCNATKGFEPRPGDQILLFVVTGPVDREDILYAPRTDQILFEGQTGVLFIPPQLKNTPELERARTLDDVLGLL
jgi:hypothetical protein